MAIDFNVNHSQLHQQSGMSTSFSAAQGSLFGKAATVVNNPMSLLANAAEELTFACDTTDDFELEERKERDAVDESRSERVKKYQKLMQEKGATEQLDRLKDSILAKTSKEEALRQTREYFPDPTDAWAALSEIYEELSNSPAPDSTALNEIKAALTHMEATDGPAIMAGLQGALAGTEFSGLGSSDTLRDFYRQAVCDFEDVNHLYSHIQDQYSGDFEQALSFLYKALGNDLAADNPSMERTHLESVNSNLGCMRSLQSAHSLCEQTMNRWQTVHGITSHQLSPMELVGDVINLRKENFLSASHINIIAHKAKAPDIERKVLFLQELLQTTRNFSPILFDGMEGRAKVINAVQDAVDAAIAEEDAWLEAQG